MSKFACKAMVGAVVATIGVIVAMVVILAMFGVNGLSQDKNANDWSYDWVAIDYDEGGSVELPAPFGDDLRKTFVELQGGTRPDRIPWFKRRSIPKVHFYKDGQVSRDYNLYGGSLQMFQEGDRYYKLDETQFGELMAIVAKTVHNPDALKQAIKRGNPRQRVRAARALLEAKKERDPAIAVLRLEVVSNNKAAAQEAIDCCGHFEIFDEKILAGLLAGLVDEDLMKAAHRALESIGPRAVASAPLLRERYSKTQGKIERYSIIKTLSAVDPRAKESRMLFLSCLNEKNADMETHIAAIDAIGRSGKEGIEHVPLLEKLIAKSKKETESRFIRFAAVKAVFSIQPDHKNLVEWLCSFLSDSRLDNPIMDTTTVVRDTIKMLGQIGQPARDALPLIRRHQTYSQDSYYQEILSEAIRRIEKR